MYCTAYVPFINGFCSKKQLSSGNCFCNKKPQSKRKRTNFIVWIIVIKLTILDLRKTFEV